MSTLVEVKNLKKYFKTPRGLVHAVDDINFKIEKGQTLGVVGESGCGKSTLGRTVIHLHERTSGQILFDGKDVSDLSKHELKEFRSHVQMIFQDPFSSLNPRMSVSQLIAEPLLIYKASKSSTDLGKEVGRLMDTVGLARRFANSYPHELDGGRRQRIGIARALSLNPEFIVCDEPISALDVSIQAQVINTLESLQEKLGLSYLFVSHDLSMVRHISHNVGVMYLGCMVERAPVQELYSNMLHPYTQALMSAVPIPDPDMAAASQRIHLSGDVPTPIDPPSGCRFRARCPYATEQCAQERPELREVAPDHFVACHRIK